MSHEEIYRPKKLTVKEIKDGCLYINGDDEEETNICVMNEELRQGFDILEQHREHGKSVTFFGSARFKEGNKYYDQAVSLAKKISTKLGYTFVTGGGPGIMEAGNRGAVEAGNVHSLGFTIALPHEQFTNKWVKEEVPFYFFFTRKTLMAYYAEAYIFFPGGFGTFDELFEMLTLIQTGKIDKVPVILVGSDFWNPVDKLIKELMIEKNQTISPEDIDLYTITDDEDEIVEIIESCGHRKNA